MRRMLETSSGARRARASLPKGFSDLRWNILSSLALEAGEGWVAIATQHVHGSRERIATVARE